MTAHELAGWAPVRIYWQLGVPIVDWCFLGDERFTDPFFEQTIERCLRRPFRMLFRRQTSIDALTELAAVRPGVPPAGFIFHTSRCGSTLVGQMLAALPEHIVISEAGPIDTVLRSHLRDGRIGDEERMAWLRGLLNAYGQRRSGPERRLYVKFDSWSVFELPLIHRAFPDVPWIFLYRDPTEVLVSHACERGSQMLPGVLQPELFGLDWSSVSALSLDEYAARVLAQICDAAVQHHELGRGRLVHYEELPATVWSDVGAFFGVNCTAVEANRMQEVARFHAKRPYQEFEPDGTAKQGAVTRELRTLAQQWTDPWYERLEALRAATHSGSGRA